jgi:hypothetical protein
MAPQGTGRKRKVWLAHGLVAVSVENPADPVFGTIIGSEVRAPSGFWNLLLRGTKTLALVHAEYATNPQPPSRTHLVETRRRPSLHRHLQVPAYS